MEAKMPAGPAGPSCFFTFFFQHKKALALLCSPLSDHHRRHRAHGGLTQDLIYCITRSSKRRRTIFLLFFIAIFSSTRGMLPHPAFQNSPDGTLPPHRKSRPGRSGLWPYSHKPRSGRTPLWIFLLPSSAPRCGRRWQSGTACPHPGPGGFVWWDHASSRIRRAALRRTRSWDQILSAPTRRGR